MPAPTTSALRTVICRFSCRQESTERLAQRQIEKERRGDPLVAAILRGLEFGCEAVYPISGDAHGRRAVAEGSERRRMYLEPDGRVERGEVAGGSDDLETGLAREPRKALDDSRRHSRQTDRLMDEIPVPGEGLQGRARSRGRAGQGLLPQEPAAGAKKIGDAPKRAYRVGLVHEEEPGVGQVEGTGERRGRQV